MRCESCNKTFPKNAKFCDVCGRNLIEREMKEIPSSKKNKKGLIITSIIVGIVLLIGSSVFFAISFLKYIDKIGTLEYIELGNDKIPTMYMSNSSIEIDSFYKEGNSNVEIEYYDNLYKYDMVTKYIEFLEEYGFDYIEEDEDDWYLIKESVDNGYVIIVNIYENYDDYSEFYFTVTYEKEYDDIENHIKSITYKRVGEEKYGFIDIDSTWKPYTGTSDMIQYEGKDGFLTLYYIEKPNFNAREYMDNIYNYIQEEGGENINVIEVNVDGYNAYQLSAYYNEDESYIAIWCFLDNNEVMHYIEIDALKYDSEAFSKIESYSVLK